MHAIVIGGGQGLRMRPLTSALPKPLLPLMGVPFAVGLSRQLTVAGVTSVTFLIGRDPAPWQPVLAAVSGTGLRADLQTEDTPLATAGGCRRLFARRPPGQAVLVCNGDVLADVDYPALLAAHEASGATATVALARVADPSAFGVIACDEQGRAQHCVEKPPPGTEPADTVNIGRYVLGPATFAGFPGDGPLSFEHDVLPGLISANRRLLGVPVRGYWQDLGTPGRYLDAHRAVLNGRCPWPVPASLRLNPGLWAVDASARVDPAATIGPMAVLGAGCTVARGASVADSVLHEDVRVGPGARLSGAVVGAGARVAGDARVIDRAVGAGEIVRPGEGERNGPDRRR